MAGEEVVGSLQAAHQWVNMTDVTVQINDTHTVSGRDTVLHRSSSRHQSPVSIHKNTFYRASHSFCVILRGMKSSILIG